MISSKQCPPSSFVFFFRGVARLDVPRGAGGRDGEGSVKRAGGQHSVVRGLSVQCGCWDCRFVGCRPLDLRGESREEERGGELEVVYWSGRDGVFVKMCGSLARQH